MANFEVALERVFEWEGGEVNDPADPGGHTKYGISARAYPGLDIGALTRAHAAEIYRRNYWLPVRGDSALLEQQTANVLFDFAVNAGVRTAVRLAQRVAGATEDGVFGPKTLAAVSQHRHFVVDFTLGRVRYYMRISKKRPRLRKFWARITMLKSMKSFMPILRQPSMMLM